MKGKQTNDLFITAHETMHSMQRSKTREGWLILKLDMNKAFDTISWNFILHMLKLFNFPAQWICLFSSLFHSFNYTPIINGNRTSTFKPQRGIRQGDPISPYLFILAMKFLSLTISEEVNKKNWSPFTFRNNNNSIKISHLLFADDILLFAKATKNNISTIKNCLSSFSNFSKLDINFEKSKLWFSKNVHSNFRTSASNSLNIPASSSLGKYLGLPLKPTYNNRDFNFILDHMSNKLKEFPIYGWKDTTHKLYS